MTAEIKRKKGGSVDKSKKLVVVTLVGTGGYLVVGGGVISYLLPVTPHPVSILVAALLVGSVYLLLGGLYICRFLPAKMLGMAFIIFGALGLYESFATRARYPLTMPIAITTVGVSFLVAGLLYFGLRHEDKPRRVNN